MALATALDSLLPSEGLGVESVGQGWGLRAGLFAGPSKNMNIAHGLMGVQEVDKASSLEIRHSWGQHVGLWPVPRQLHRSP